MDNNQNFWNNIPPNTNNWGETQNQTSEPNTNNWGEPQNQTSEPVQLNWEETNEPTPLPNEPAPPSIQEWNTSDPTSPKSTPQEQLPRHYSFLGSTSIIDIKSELYQLNVDIKKATKDLEDSELTLINNDNKYDFSPKENTELGNVIANLVSIFKSKSSKINNCHIIINKPGQSSLLTDKTQRGYKFIYFLQADYISGDVQIDLSSVNGPTTRIIDSSPNILAIVPGWVNINITKNNSQKDLIAVVGTTQQS
jgi:hypothetical protein